MWYDWLPRVTVLILPQACVMPSAPPMALICSMMSSCAVSVPRRRRLSATMVAWPVGVSGRSAQPCPLKSVLPL